MNTLDERARRAGQAIHDAVAGYEPEPAVVPILGRRKALWQGAQLAAAAVAIAAVMGVITLVTAPDRDAAVTTTTPETTTTETPSTVAPEPTVPPTTVAEAPPATAPPAKPPTTADATAPPLVITSPEPDAHMATEVVTFRGTTEPGASVVAAGKFAAAVDGAGRWSIDLVLAPGRNRASFAATDAAGNQTLASVVVWFDAPEPPKEESPSIEFTAHASYGSCSETPPFDVYYGTATPGTVITVSSPFGSGVAEVGGEGQWERKVYFEIAPAGEPFVVTVTDEAGHSKTFEFVSYSGL